MTSAYGTQMPAMYLLMMAVVQEVEVLEETNASLFATSVTAEPPATRHRLVRLRSLQTHVTCLQIRIHATTTTIAQ